MPRHKIPSEHRAFAKTQRRTMNEAGGVLWSALRDSELKYWKFRRQAPIGRYVVDFVCPAARLIIEADGPLHNSNEARLHDMRCDVWLRSEGFDGYRMI